MTKSTVKTRIMGIDFVNTTMSRFLSDSIEPRLQQEKQTFVVTANPEIVMQTRKDSAYKGAIQSSDYVVPDGIGIIKAASWLKEPLQERIAGFDLTLELLQIANDKGYACYFLGATEEVNAIAVQRVCEEYPNIPIAGRKHGFFDFSDEEIAREIAGTNPDIVFVALGLPRQELWIKQYKRYFDKGLFIGVGGSFDVLAGKVNRAPEIWIKLNLEWFYRLLKQPSRWKRILKIFQFMFLVLIGKGKKE